MYIFGLAPFILLHNRCHKNSYSVGYVIALSIISFIILVLYDGKELV